MDALVAAVGGDQQESAAGPAGANPAPDARARERIDALLGTLEEEEQAVLRQVHGLDGIAATLAETSERTGLSVEALRRTAEQALVKLRQPDRYQVAVAA